MMLALRTIVNGVLLFVMPLPANSPWQLVKDSTEAATFDSDHAVAHSGAASGRLTVVKSGGHEIAALQPFRADGWRGKRVLLTGWVRTDLSAGEAGIAIITNNAGRNNVYYPSEQRLTKRTDWQKLSVACDVPADTILLSIGVWVRHGSGSVWLDGVTFGSSNVTSGSPPAPRNSPALTRDQMNSIAEVYKTAASAPFDLDFEQP